MASPSRKSGCHRFLSKTAASALGERQRRVDICVIVLQDLIDVTTSDCDDGVAPRRNTFQVSPTGAAHNEVKASSLSQAAVGDK